MSDNWGENDEVVQQSGSFGDDDKVVQDNPLKRGLKQASQRMAISKDLGLQDYASAAQNIAEAHRYAQANPGSKEAQELSAAWERGEGVTGGISEVASEFGKDWDEADGIGQKVGSVGKNLQAMGGGILAQMGNMIAPVTGMAGGALAGGKGGALVGTAVGGPAGTAAGTAIGAGIGAWGGASAGNALVEGGGIAQEALMNAGIDPEDLSAVEGYLRENGNTILKQAGIKGGIIGGVDVLTAGAASKLLRGPVNAATSRAMAQMGVDMTDKAAVKAAIGTEQFSKILAQDAAFQASKQGAEKIARNVTAAALDPAGEFAGEYLGSGIALNDWDVKNAALEAFSSIGQSGVMYAGQKAFQYATDPLRGRKSEEGQPGAPSDQASVGGLPSGTPPAGYQAASPVQPAAPNADVADMQTSQPVPASQQMGLDPDAGPMSSAAATAVDSGASQQLAQQEALQQAAAAAQAEQATQQAIETPIRSLTPNDLSLMREAGYSDESINAFSADESVKIADSLAEAKSARQMLEGLRQQAETTGWTPELTAARTEAGQVLSRTQKQRPQTPVEQAGSTWNTMTTQERAVAIQAAGVTGVPAKHLATRTWESMSDKQRASLTEPVNAQQGSRWTDPNRRAKDQQGPVLQPRDRSQEKAIEQMANIAAKPDYAKASYSRTFTDGAPVTIDEISDLPADQRGRQEQVTTAGDRKIPVQYAVVEADRLLASNDTTGAPNTDYAAGTAGKSRAIAGNGRVAGLTKAWERGTATQYKTDMMNDDLHGIDPAVIKRMKKPVLVRLMPQSEVTNDIGDVSNLDGKLSSTPVEQAKADGRAIDLASLKYNDEGGFGGDTARDFVNKLPGATNLISNGKVTQAGIDRLTAAVFQKAYNNDALTELLTESSEGARSVINALAQAAPHMTKLEGTLSFDIRGLVAQAAEVALTASRSKESLASVIQQTDMGVDPHVYPILEMMVNEKGNVRSAKYIAEQLINLANLAHYEATQPSADMFGERPQRTTQQLIDDAFSGVKGHVERTEQAETNSEQPGSGEDLRQPTGPEPAAPVDAGQTSRPEQPESAGQPAQAEPAAEVEQQEARAPEVQLSESGKTVYVYGDRAEIRAKLREAGIALPGAEIEDGLSFAAKLEDRIREALNAPAETVEETTSQTDDYLADTGETDLQDNQQPEVWRTTYPAAAKKARELGIDPKQHRKLPELVAAIDMAGMTIETVEGRKVYPTPVKQDGKVVVLWAVQSGDNMRLAEQGKNRVFGDTLHNTKELAVETAKREAAADAKRQVALAEKEQADKDAKAQEEARKSANRGKSITERRAAAELEKRNTYPTAFGFGAMSRKDALEKAVRDGHAIVEVSERDTAARKRDEDAIKYARERGYILGASNENIPAVKKGLEAQKRLKANDYTKPAYRLHADGTTRSSYTTITKTEYDYAQQLDEAQDQGFDLNAQTEEGLAQQEADRKAQAEAEAKQKAKEEAAAKKRKEQEADKARADEVADSFELGQDANEAMSGVGDMFGQQQGARGQAGKELTPQQRKETWETLKDVYAENRVEKVYKGIDASGNERIDYKHSPEHFVKSDITGKMLRHYVTLPGGRIAHPSELFDGVTQADVERRALDSMSKSQRQQEFDNAMKSRGYDNLPDAETFTGENEIVVHKGGTYSAIPDSAAARKQAEAHGWSAANQQQAAGKPAYQLARDEWVDQEIRANKYAEEYLADPKDYEAKARQLAPQWLEAIHEQAKTERIPTEVLDDVFRHYGAEGVLELRGAKEKGIEGYEMPDSRLWDKTYSQVQAMRKRGATPSTGINIRQLHRESILRAIGRGETIPDNVLNEYPQLQAAGKPEAENSKVTAHGVTVTVPAISKDLNDDYNRATHMGRGRDFNAELARETENIVNDLAGRKHTLETDEQKDKAAELIEDYLKNQADFMAWEARHAANNPSWFVTGRDGRNMAKASKANERHMDQYGARVERLEKQRKDIAKTLYDMRPESVKDSQANNKDLNEIAQLAGDILNYIKTSKPVLAKETRAWASPKAHKLMERALNADREGTIKTIQKMDAVQAVQDAGGLAAVFGPRSKAGKLVTELLAESKEAKTEPKFSFAGEKSGTAMHQELSRAKWLTAKGMTSEEVRQETGWHRGNDGKWRYEISDHDAKLKADAQTMGEVIDLATLNAMAEGRKRSTIGDVLEHDALFRAYPHLAEIPVIKLPNPKPNSVAAVGMIDGEFVVALNPQARGDYAVSALLHELQHAIQRFEGFARGGNSAMAARLQGLDALDKKAVNAYMRLQGEIEARNTQARRLMDDNFRKLFAPAETQDIQDKDAIVTFNGSELEDLTQAPAISRQEVRDVFAAQFPKLAKAIDRMLERGDKRQSGGLIILDSADPLMIARQYSDITGTNLSHAIRVFDNAEGAQGFFDQKSGLIFLVGPSVNADNVASVILHEALHSQQHKLVDDAAMAMLINRKHEKNAKTKAFLDRVARRMSRSQGGITHPEAAAYIVETALMEGRDGTRNEAVDGKLMDWIESNLGKAIADLVRSFATAYRQFALRNGLGVKVNVDDLIQYAQASMKQSAAEGAAPYGGTRGNGVQRSAAGQSPEDAAQVEAAIEGKDIHQIAEYLVSSMDSSRSAVAAAVAKKLKALAHQGVKFDFRKTAIGTYAPSALNHSRGYTEFEFDESAALNVTVWMHGSEMTGRVGMDNEYILHELVHAATGAAVQLGRMHPKGEYGALNNALLDVREAVVERLLERRKELGDSGLTDFENDVLAGSNNSIQSEDEVLAWGLTNPGMQALMEDTKYKKVGAWGEFVSIIRQLLGLNKDADTALSELLRIADKLLDAEGYEAAQLRNIAKFGHPMYSTQGTRNKWGMANPVKPAADNAGDFNQDTGDIRFSRAASAQAQAAAQQAPNTLSGPAASKWDDFIYKIQDKHIDTKRIVQAVKDTAGGISDALDTYLQETLYHGRAAKRTQDFVSKELGDLTRAMQQGGISKDALEEYLHARHAQEANEVLAERNPNQAMIDAGLARANATITRVQEALDADPRNKDLKRELKDAQLEAKKWRTAKPFKGTEAERNSLSGMSNAEAQAVLASLNPIQQRHMDRATGMIDAMIAKTRQEMVDYGLESQDTVDEWAAQWSHYIPLMREQLEDETGGMRGIGQGYSVKGREAKGRTGSNKQVVDILANIALQRERTIVRGEKNRVAQSLLGLARANSIDGFWTTDTVPTVREIDPATGLVRSRPDPTYRSKPNALIAKVDGKEVAVLFDEDNPRAMRMATAMKNLDAAQMEGLMGAVATATRYFAAVNTQYNPIFGVTNFVRDLQHAMLALSNTPLHGKQAEIAGNTFSAIGQVYRAERANRKGQTSGSQWGQLWEEFQQVGGQTGYRDQYANAADRGKAIEKALDPDAWAKSKLGRLITADGRLKAPLAAVRKAGGWLFDLLSDYNTAMENGVRLSAYKAGLDAGLSKERAAELAKNLTVNFNRKGQATQQIGAMYAFFNAAVQGTTRIGETLFEMEPGKPKTARLSKGGKAIMTGGVMLGSMQAVLLAAAGFGDDEPAEVIRERNLIIPTGGKTYISIPMPLGYHVITNLGRIPTEFALGGGKDLAKHMGSLMDVMADIYNPLGGAGLSLQSIAPTVIDPFAALAENKDFGGRAIAKQSFDKTTPGHQLARDNASLPATWLAQAINYVTGGTEFTRGELSPTPDQIDYLVGQITGGVGREATKVWKTAQMWAQGDEWLWHNVPLLGRFIGDAGNSAGKQSAYYNALNDVNRHAAEVKGLRNSGRYEEASRYLSKHPEAGMQTIARAADKQIKNLRDLARDLTEQGASRAEVRAVEQQMISIMERFSQQMEARR